MKFTGLILICATSCLALILPAIGVVHFPKAQLADASGSISATSNSSVPVMMQNTLNPIPNSSLWTPATPQYDIKPSLNGMPNSPFPGSTFSSASLPQPQLINPASLNADATLSSNKLGMEIWLLLGPVCLIGLAMWSFSPNPSVAKPKS